uniref:Up-regulator of cell proliferation isoform X3 n=2 Tax=Geotrypetes seraphini TaxID=260995 RepID=A0A6P8REU2_GEOSA|nr:up-regulator of cell proliferation isoform X3 [Geotrypetes seraphini]
MDKTWNVLGTIVTAGSRVLTHVVHSVFQNQIQPLEASGHDSIYLEGTSENASTTEISEEETDTDSIYLEGTSENASTTEISEEETDTDSIYLEGTSENASTTEISEEETDTDSIYLEGTSENASTTEISEEETGTDSIYLEGTSENASTTEISEEETGTGSLDQEMTSGNLSTAETPKEETDTDKKIFKEVLSQLGLEDCRTTKISLRDALQIGLENFRNIRQHTLEDLPWHFLQKVLALDVNARSATLEQSISDEGHFEDADANSDIFYLEKKITRVSVNPLDVLCALFHCTDSFLQQEIMLKMSMCQFALPLLFPPSENTRCTLILWAMRDIVKKWRPHSLKDSKGFQEESLVLISMPTISFVRIGNCSLSKSKILNEVLSPPQQHHDFFIHRNMDSGNIPRRISEGLVEISWYFPGGNENSDLFPEPIAVANLRGDIQSFWLQFSFLTEVSSAVFVLVENITEREYELLSSLKESKPKYFFIFYPQTNTSDDTLRFLNKLVPVLKLKRSHLLVKDYSINDAQFVKKLQLTILDIIKQQPIIVAMESMAVTARELGIQVDEDYEECQKTSQYAKEITAEINDVLEYKTEMMRLQGDPWKNLTKIEKELCRMRKQGSIPPEAYKSDLTMKLFELRKQQNQYDLTDGMIKFINGIQHLSGIEKHYFLKWMKFSLDFITRKNLSVLGAEYRKTCEGSGNDSMQLRELDQRIYASSLGLEHFMREMGQLYEAECSMIQEGTLQEEQRQFIHLPSIAADLLLDGFPLELIDGDASNIPLQWITDVLSMVDTKLEGKCQMVIITVLGVQSTGKSTLLNAMFGLQFSVSSGRCTRGAFMLLIRVKENLKEELGYDFIMVIDTEGLKAPELAKLEDSYEHDNELATLVIGLSDITIVNMAMENATEMKDILQIVVHAFLRMEQTGKKPSCHFVHQNVSDVSAHEQNRRDRKYLLEQLNEMTEAAAKMEKQIREVSFSDIMDYDLEKHNWYIPGLWHGVPPMASVNAGYSENVQELKKYLIQLIKEHSIKEASQDIPKFTKWLNSLWNAVKHENFIFSFRNSLVAEAYNHISMKYSEWEWSFCRAIHYWVSEAESSIQNHLLNEIDGGTFKQLEHEMFHKLQQEENKILACIENYFKSDAKNLHLIEKYREDFIISAKSLQANLQSYSLRKCEEAKQILKNKNRIETMQAGYIKTIEKKVISLLKDCKKRGHKLEDQELEREFEAMWENTLAELQLTHLERYQVHEEMLCHLFSDMSKRGPAINQKLRKIKSLLNYGNGIFSMKKNYLELSWFKGSIVTEFFTHEYFSHGEALAKHLVDTCDSYVDQKVRYKSDYDATYCQELLHIINETLQQDDSQKLPFSSCFEVDLKLHILGQAAHRFQIMHEDFIKDNDPHSCLEKYKSQFFSTFKDVYWEKDESQKRARDFWNQCLKPAVLDHVEKALGIEIVDDILHNEHSFAYSSRTFFQFSILNKLLEDQNCDKYVEYIKNYEIFVKNWIWRHILFHYNPFGGLGALEETILYIIIKKIRKTLQTLKEQHVNTIPALLDNFCKMLQKDLVIPKDSLKLILFQNKVNVEQFIFDTEFLLSEQYNYIVEEFQLGETKDKLSKLPFKPQDEIFKKVFGCGKQCPFCKVPCEAGGTEHKDHFASVHRPQGLGAFSYKNTGKLVESLCSSDVVSNCLFRNLDTNGAYHPYKEYRTYYPDWLIQPDSSIEASDYWKFVLKEFNEQFAKIYKAKPADIPNQWKKITFKEAQKSLYEAFNVKKI